jgi:hypothetical protein
MRTQTKTKTPGEPETLLRAPFIAVNTQADRNISLNGFQPNVKAGKLNQKTNDRPVPSKDHVRERRRAKAGYWQATLRDILLDHIRRKRREFARNGNGGAQ